MKKLNTILTVFILTSTLALTTVNAKQPNNKHPGNVPDGATHPCANGNGKQNEHNKHCVQAATEVDKNRDGTPDTNKENQHTGIVNPTTNPPVVDPVKPVAQITEVVIKVSPSTVVVDPVKSQGATNTAAVSHKQAPVSKQTPAGSATTTLKQVTTDNTIVPLSQMKVPPTPVTPLYLVPPTPMKAPPTPNAKPMLVPPTPMAKPNLVPAPMVRPNLMPPRPMKVPPTPNAKPNLAPQATPMARPNLAPQATPMARPNLVPQAMPMARPNLVPQATPMARPNLVPQATPMARPNLRPATPLLNEPIIPPNNPMVSLHITVRHGETHGIHLPVAPKPYKGTNTITTSHQHQNSANHVVLQGGAITGSVVHTSAPTHHINTGNKTGSRPITSGRYKKSGYYNFNIIEPGIQNKEVAVYRTDDARQMKYKDAIEIDHTGGFLLIDHGTRDPIYHR